MVFGALGVGLLLFSYVKLTQSVLGPFLPATAQQHRRRHPAFRLKAAGRASSPSAAAPGSARCCEGSRRHHEPVGHRHGRRRRRIVRPAEDEYRILPPGTSANA